MTSSNAKYRTFNRELLGALVLVIFATQGAVFSVIFTVLKFRVEQTCDGTLVNTCNAGCDATLSDSWSTLLGVPITIFAAAAYLVQAAFGMLMIVRPRVFIPLVRGPALLLAWVGLLVSAVFAVRAAFVLHAWCHLCVILYMVALAVFRGAWALDHEGPVGGLRAALRRADLEIAVVSLAAAAAMATVVVVQDSMYRRTGGLTCPELRQKQLPDTKVSMPSDGRTEVAVGLFIDLTCVTCRREFAVWRELHAKYREFLRVDLLHYPMDAACGAPSSAHSSQNHACVGAVALQCLVEAAPERQMEIVDEMYALQSGAGAMFTAERIEALRQRLGLPDISICMGTSPAVVHHHVEFALNMRLTGAPTAVVATVCPVVSDQILRAYSGGKDRTLLERAIHEARQKGVECNAAK